MRSPHEQHKNQEQPETEEKASINEDDLRVGKIQVK